MDPVLDAERLATMVRLESFDDRKEWQAVVEQLRRRGPRGQRMVKRLREDH